MKYYLVGASLVAQAVKNLPAMLQTWVQSLGGEDPLEKEMATHSSILAWWAQSRGSQRVGHNLMTKARTIISHWKRPSCWERLKAKGEGGGRGGDG